jgi:hypothetical protein
MLPRYRKTALPALLGAILAMPVPGLAQEAAPALACAGATAWEAAHPEQTDQAMAARDAARTLRDPALRAELDARFTRDQDARHQWIADHANRRLTRAVNEIDAENLAWLHKLVRVHGFPTAAQVGERGVQDGWLLAQHADTDPPFQAELLPALQQRYVAGELSGISLSRFADRVAKAYHQPQRYATQFTTEAWATSHFGLPDEDSVRAVDAHRRDLGIMPLADYVCMMSRARNAHL